MIHFYQELVDTLVVSLTRALFNHVIFKNIVTKRALRFMEKKDVKKLINMSPQRNFTKNKIKKVIIKCNKEIKE